FPTCNFTKIQKVYILCRYWLKQQNTPYGKANLAIRCILIISHFPFKEFGGEGKQIFTKSALLIATRFGAGLSLRTTRL
ncbi:MAG: hypothetical protein IJC69_06820, partial [Clostridia bacterium]|nr:hypothetical protein [Clostridia bacterium]